MRVIQELLKEFEERGFGLGSEKVPELQGQEGRAEEVVHEIGVPERVLQLNFQVELLDPLDACEPVSENVENGPEDSDLFGRGLLLPPYL